MTNEKLLKLWEKECLNGNLTPMALVCVDNDGFPYVLTQHDVKLMQQVWKHLAESPLIDESTTFDGQEN